MGIKAVKRAARKNEPLALEAKRLLVTADQLDRAQDAQWKLAAVVESSRDFIGIASLEGNALFLNPAGQQLVGLDSDEQVRTTTVHDYIFKEDQERFRDEVMREV